MSVACLLGDVLQKELDKRASREAFFVLRGTRPSCMVKTQGFFRGRSDNSE